MNENLNNYETYSFYVRWQGLYEEGNYNRRGVALCCDAWDYDLYAPLDTSSPQGELQALSFRVKQKGEEYGIKEEEVVDGYYDLSLTDEEISKLSIAIISTKTIESTVSDFFDVTHDFVVNSKIKRKQHTISLDSEKKVLRLDPRVRHFITIRDDQNHIPYSSVISSSFLFFSWQAPYENKDGKARRIYIKNSGMETLWGDLNNKYSAQKEKSLLLHYENLESESLQTECIGFLPEDLKTMHITIRFFKQIGRYECNGIDTPYQVSIDQEAVSKLKESTSYIAKIIYDKEYRLVFRERKEESFEKIRQDVRDAIQDYVKKEEEEELEGSHSGKLFQRTDGSFTLDQDEKNTIYLGGLIYVLDKNNEIWRIKFHTAFENAPEIKDAFKGYKK